MSTIFWLRRAPLLATLGLMVPLPSPVAAQASEPAPVAQEVVTAEPRDNGYLALGGELLRFNERVAALERLITQLVARQDEDHRSLTLLTDELARFRSDAEARLGGVGTAPPAGPMQAAPAPIMPVEPSLPQTPEIDRFEQALAFAQAQDWPSAEFVLETFIANNPGDERLAKARYHLGTAYLEQGQAGQAAAIFLDLFETGAAADFGAENLFALAGALGELGDIDATQLCSVYAEIDRSHGVQLDTVQREKLLDLRLASDCEQ